jgi:hypothetical protein
LIRPRIAGRAKRRTQGNDVVKQHVRCSIDECRCEEMRFSRDEIPRYRTMPKNTPDFAEFTLGRA